MKVLFHSLSSFLALSVTLCQERSLELRFFVPKIFAGNHFFHQVRHFLFCLLSKYRMAWIIFFLFLIKEGCMAVGGMMTISRTHKNDGAKWYGKISTAIFYMVVLVLNLFPHIKKRLQIFYWPSVGFLCLWPL